MDARACAGPGAADHVHRRLSGRDRRGVRAPAGQREPPALQPGGCLHLLGRGGHRRLPDARPRARAGQAGSPAPADGRRARGHRRRQPPPGGPAAGRAGRGSTRAGLGVVGRSLVPRRARGGRPGADERRLKGAGGSDRPRSGRARAQLRPAGPPGRARVTEAGEALAGQLLARAAERGLTLAVAEADTGGLVLAWLTAWPGSSAVVLGGVVAYADALKQGLVGVDAKLIAAHGAVSQPVVEAMAV